MSFERYVRIGHTCRFKPCNYFTEDNFKYYVIALILGPCIFYVPKYFELRTEKTSLPVKFKVDCEPILLPTAPEIGNWSGKPV